MIALFCCSKQVEEIKALNQQPLLVKQSFAVFIQPKRIFLFPNELHSTVETTKKTNYIFGRIRLVQHLEVALLVDRILSKNCSSRCSSYLNSSLYLLRIINYIFQNLSFILNINNKTSSW